MKKFLALFFVCLIFLAVCGCGQSSENQGTVTIVVNSGEIKAYSVDLASVTIDEGVLSVLKYLKEKENLTLNYSTDSYGAFITQIGDCKVEKSNEYVAVWTSYEPEFDVSGYATEREYNGVLLCSAGFGVSSLSVRDKVIIYFEIASF